MIKKSFILKSSAFMFGVLLFGACSNADSPIPEPVPDVDVVTDYTIKVATDGWGQGGFAGAWAAPEVDTEDGRHSAMAEVYKSTNEDVAATGSVMEQNKKKYLVMALLDHQKTLEHCPMLLRAECYLSMSPFHLVDLKNHIVLNTVRPDHL